MESSRPFDPWSAAGEEAAAAQSAFAGPSHAGPIHQWSAARRITERERSCRSDGYEVLWCVHLCAAHDLTMPDWLAKAFLLRFRLVNDCQVASWDEAFGPPFPAGAHVKRLRNRRRMRFAAAVEAHSIIDADPTSAIDKEFFAKVGKTIGAGASLAEDLYREAVKLGAVDVALLKKRRLAGKF